MSSLLLHHEIYYDDEPNNPGPTYGYGKDGTVVQASVRLVLSAVYPEVEFCMIGLQEVWIFDDLLWKCAGMERSGCSECEANSNDG